MSKARELADVIGTQDTTENVLQGRRNLVINGAMQVAQRGTSFNLSTSTYTLDRWEVNPGANPAVAAVTQETFAYNDDMLVNEGFTNYLRTEVTTAYGLGSYDNRHIRYYDEDVRQLAGKQVTISFWAKASSNTKMGLETRQYDGATNTDTKYLSPYNSPDGNEFNITTSWQKFTHTFTVPALTTGITGSANATYTQIMLLADNNTANLQHDITGVQLEVGSVATPFEHRSYGEELALCQRYYQSHDGITYNVGGSSGTGSSHDWYSPLRYTVDMRATPSATIATTLYNCTTNGFLIDSARSGRLSVRPTVTTECNVIYDTLRLDAEL